MTVDYPRLAELIGAGAVSEVVDALVAADEKTRRALVPELRHHVEQISRSWERRRIEAWPLLVAGAGCVPGAAGVVSWLRHRELRWDLRGRAPEPVVRVLSAPGRPAPAVVGRQLADRMRATTIDFDWPIAEALLRAGRADPSVGDVFVRGWARHRLRAATIQRPLVDLLRGDPWLPAMVGRMFEVDTLAVELEGDWPEALVELCAQARVEREQVLAGCLWRMRAGDRPVAMGRVLAIHVLLEVTPDEIAAHRQEYLGLLSSPSAPVAEHAQFALRQLHTAGRLPVDAMVDSSHAVLLRREKKLVRAQLSWLDSAANRSPEQLPQLLGAAATGLGNEASDLADRALEVIAKHLPGAGDDGRKAVIAALPELAGDLARRVAELLGVQPASVAAAVPAGDVPLGEPVQPMPPPIGSLGELVGEVRRILGDPSDPIALERILDAALRFGRTDRAALATALTPVLPAWGGGEWYGELWNVLRAAGGQPHRSAPPMSGRATPAPPEQMLTARLAELAERLTAAPPPATLLATPATVDGHVDPERVLHLLVQAERDGTRPGSFDLTQALLRLPRTVDRSVHAAAAALDAPAGRLFRRWLAGGGLTDPAVVRIRAPKPECRSSHTAYYAGYQCYCMRLPAFRLTVEVPAPPAKQTAELALPGRLLHLPGGSEAQQRCYGQHWAPPMGLWPAVTPSHREIAAAHIQPIVAPAADDGRSGGTETLPALARCSGPPGPAMALALAYGLAAKRERDRLPAVDALALLAGRGELAGLQLGRELGELTSEAVVVLARVVAALGEASRAGAAGAVWDIASAMLPALLRQDKPRSGVPDLLALAATAAEATPASAGADRDVRAIVGQVAARAGGTRLVTEAQRLARVLN